MTFLLAVVTSFFAWNLQFLAFDFEFEKFFPKNHPDSYLYKEHVTQFGYDNDFLHIILTNEPSVFDPSFLSRASQFEKELKKIDDVIQVYSPLSLQHVIKTPTGLIIFPLIHSDNAEKLRTDSIRIFGNPFYKVAFSDDGNAMSIYLKHSHFDDPDRTERILSAITNKATLFGLSEVKLVGKLSASHVFIQYIKEDFGKFLVGSLGLSFVLLLLIFKNLKSAMLPFFISLLSLIWLFGTMGVLGIKINLLSSLLPPILFFTSMSDAVHLMNALKKTKADSKSNEFKKALAIVWTPTLLTSITTAIGFLSLAWIKTEPVQLVGIFASVGILAAFIITFSFGLLIASFTDFSSTKKMIAIPSGMTEFLLRKKWIIGGVAVVLIGLSIPSALNLKVDSFLLDDLPSSSSVSQDFQYADENLGGSKPFEIRVEVVDSNMYVWDHEVLDEIVKIEYYLINEYPVVKVQSPATIIKYLNMVNNGGLNEAYRYPESEEEFNQIIGLKNRIDPKRMDKLVTEDGRVTRLIGFIPEFGSHETAKRNQQLLDYLSININKELIRYRITGTTYLIDKSHELLSRNLFIGLFTAIGIVSLILGIYFRSWKLLIISLIPNLIPLIMIAGILGLLGISLKMTTSIIFTIAFGIAVDDTIHMMSYYLQNKTSDPKVRMQETFKHAGSAMLITSLIMTAGFALFLLSNFGATYYMGLFISLSLTIALVIDLTVLPLLLITYIKNAPDRRSSS